MQKEKDRLKSKESKAKDANPGPWLWEQNPEITAAMLGALGENPEANGLNDEQRLEVVELALRERRLQDADWLAATLLKIKVEGSLFKPSAEQIAEKRIAAISISKPVAIQSQEDLDEVMKAHAAWIKQTLEPGQDLGAGRANLKGNDLRAYCFDGLDLRSANLEACNLSGCSLIAANLAGSNLSKANLQNAQLHKARLRRANLSQSQLDGAELREADLRQANLEGVSFDGARLSGARCDENAPKKLRDLIASSGN